jgi:hypothetical protein
MIVPFDHELTHSLQPERPELPGRGVLVQMPERPERPFVFFEFACRNAVRTPVMSIGVAEECHRQFIHGKILGDVRRGKVPAIRLPFSDDPGILGTTFGTPPLAEENISAVALTIA